MLSFNIPPLAGLGQDLHVVLKHRLERLLVSLFRMQGAMDLTRSWGTKASWTYTGCSHHGVSSLSKTAMRCSIGTKKRLGGRR
jgi:hypothetical protein